MFWMCRASAAIFSLSLTRLARLMAALCGALITRSPLLILSLTPHALYSPIMRLRCDSTDIFSRNEYLCPFGKDTNHGRSALSGTFGLKKLAPSFWSNETTNQKAGTGFHKMLTLL